MEHPNSADESDSKKQANLPQGVKDFMEDRSYLLVNQNTESFEGETTILFDTVYGLRVTKTEQDGGVMLSFALVPSSVSVHPLPPEERHDYTFFPTRNSEYFCCTTCKADINVFPNLVKYYKAWRDYAEADAALLLEKLQVTDPTQWELVSTPNFDNYSLIMDWKIEGFLMACWIALQHDVGTVSYCTGSWNVYSLNKDNNDLDVVFFNLITDKNEPHRRPLLPLHPVRGM
ncbi:hypothetical protein F4806DRAFT_504733 [Annulohypoxylon nitens]|nr:hypothetical protein F4806DRAFT_504733 [Annulohypoxylon nitens]